MPSTYSGSPSFPTSVTIPSDGDGPIKAADVNPGFEGLADRTVYLYNRLPAPEEAYRIESSNDPGAWTAWKNLQDTGGTINEFYEYASELQVPMPGLTSGTVILLDLEIVITTSATACLLALGFVSDAATDPMTPIDASKRPIQLEGAGPDYLQSLHVAAAFTVSGSGDYKAVVLYNNTDPSTNVKAWGNAYMRVLALRGV